MTIATEPGSTYPLTGGSKQAQLARRLRNLIFEWRRRQPAETLAEFRERLLDSLVEGLLAANADLPTAHILHVAAATVLAATESPPTAPSHAARVLSVNLAGAKVIERFAVPESKDAVRRLGSIVRDIAVPIADRHRIFECATRAAGVPLPLPKPEPATRPLAAAKAVERVRAIAPFVLGRSSDLGNRLQPSDLIEVERGRLPAWNGSGAVAVAALRDIESALRAAFDDALGDTAFTRATARVYLRQSVRPTDGTKEIAVEIVAALLELPPETVATYTRPSRHKAETLTDSYTRFLEVALLRHPAFHRPGRHHRSATRYLRSWLGFARPDDA